MQRDIEVVAIYFPSWHANDHYQAWYGQGFTEWELVKSARPLYPGHHQPKVPSWGYFDESNPEWAAKEIDLAADNGVTTFLFDWYWYSGVRIMEEALEQGFLRAHNRNRLKFSLMWANHNWGAWPAMTGAPGMAGSASGPSVWLPIQHSMKDLDRVVDYCCEHYFFEPNYWTIDDRPNFAIYDMPILIKQLGGVDNLRAGLERMDKRAQKHGLPGLYYTVNVGCCESNVYCCGWDLVPSAAEIGFSSVFAYNIVRTPQYDHLPDNRPIVNYEDVIDSHRCVWNQLEQGVLSHHPVITMGCDVSPRWHQDVSLPMDFRALNYEPIVEGNTPDRFGYLCQLALEQAINNGSDPKAIVINAWNEWTEGMFLLPEERYGTGYLEALKDALAAVRRKEMLICK